MGYGWKLDLGPSEKLVYLAVADHVDDDGEGCFASYSTLAAKTNLDRSTVMRIIAKFEKAGIILHQGTHPKYGTNVWNIDKDKLPFKEQVKSAPLTQLKPDQRRRARPKAEPNATAAAEDAFLQESCDGTPASRTMPPGESHHATPASRATPPNPSVKPLVEPSVEPPARRSAKPLPPAMDARVNPAAKTKTARERAASEQGTENDPRTRERPETALQIKIAQLTHSKYLPISTKAKLRNGVTAAWGDNKLPVTHPSPEDEWTAHPRLFAEYVELCARRIREESTRPPSRAALVESIRNYTRYNTGWLDFKRAAQEEKRQAEKRADPSAKHNQWYYDPNKPDWMQ